MSKAALRHAGALAFGALVFLAAFHYHLAAVPPANYQDRDDALITLSHARNLVEFGFIGVNPSGERVEGFSAPLQFWVAAAAYAISPFEYSTFFRAQTVLGTLALGACLAGLLFGSPEPAGRCRTLFVALAVVASAQLLADSRVFLLWHASGMENAFKSVGLLALLWSLDAMLRAQRVRWSAAALIPLVALTRADAIVPVTLLLASFVLLWWIRHRSGAALRVALLGLLPWAGYMAWRWWYFGQWDPNTAIAQHISVTSRLQALVHAPGAAGAEILQWTIEIGRSLHAFQLGWIVVLLVALRRQPVARHRAALLLSGAAACLLQYTLFGPARLDIARTVTDLAIYSALAGPFVLLGARDFRTTHVAAGAAMLLISVAVAARMPPDRTEIGWGATVFEATARQLEAIGRDHRLARPSVAIADLGAVSWSKQVNVVDIGLLGSAIVPRLDAVGDYVSGVAAPDLIEIHDAWSCLYRDLFTAAAFKRDYVAVAASRTPWLAANCAAAPDAMTGIWIRRAMMKDSGSVERVFTDAFSFGLEASLVQQELSTCRAAAGSRPCAHVGRALFRFVPELQRRGEYERIAGLLAADPRLRLEHAYFTSSTNPRWWRDVLAAVQPVRVSPEKLSFFTLIDGSRASRTRVIIDDPLERGWRVAPPADLFDIQPRSGTGTAHATFIARPQQAETDRTIEVPVYSGSDAAPAKTLTVRFRAVRAVGSGAPAGSVDTPPGPVQISSESVTFQGWAVDGFDVRAVFVGYMDRSGRMVTLAEARRSGARPDVAALYPDAYDIFNTGWTLVLDARTLRGLPKPTLLNFVARGATREAEIGTRMLVK